MGNPTAPLDFILKDIERSIDALYLVKELS